MELANALPVLIKLLQFILKNVGYRKILLTFLCPLVAVAKGLLIMQKTLQSELVNKKLV